MHFCSVLCADSAYCVCNVSLVAVLFIAVCVVLCMFVIRAQYSEKFRFPVIQISKWSNFLK